MRETFANYCSVFIVYYIVSKIRLPVSDNYIRILTIYFSTFHLALNHNQTRRSFADMFSLKAPQINQKRMATQFKFSDTPWTYLLTKGKKKNVAMRSLNGIHCTFLFIVMDICGWCCRHRSPKIAYSISQWKIKSNSRLTFNFNFNGCL